MRRPAKLMLVTMIPFAGASLWPAPLVRIVHRLRSQNRLAVIVVAAICGFALAFTPARHATGADLFEAETGVAAQTDPATALVAPTQLTRIDAATRDANRRAASRGETPAPPGQSLDDAVGNLQAFRSDSRWDANWPPLLANGGGDFYVADLGVRSATIRHFRIEESVHPIEFSSLRSMLLTIARASKLGIIFVGESAYLELDDHMFVDLAAAMNPEVEWWRG